MTDVTLGGGGRLAEDWLPDLDNDEGDAVRVREFGSFLSGHGHMVALLETLGAGTGEGVAPLAGLQHRQSARSPSMITPERWSARRTTMHRRWVTCPR
jgi:hypothetical protein